MSIRVTTMEIRGNTQLEENHLPKFRDKIQNKQLNGEGLLEKEREKYGYQTGDRVLPYTMQDIYSRDRRDISVKAIEMENDHLKAVFLPEYGMRLFSLYSKDLNRELLFRNSVLQFANLAIRDAWFSGGIEWNVGQLGHTFTTCDNLFAAVCRDEEGKEFLRCYEYERCKGIYWQVDFHLEEEDRQLAAYVRFINPKEEAVPFYWWTNIAVPEEKNIRVFSGNSAVIYISHASLESEDAVKGMLHGNLPELSALPGKDASYPQNYNFSSEYFFQNEHDIDQTWEAAVYDDGFMFYDYASERLQYHKMFCWGTHQGGERWKEFLSEPGRGAYVELQAGLAPTQVHGLDMPGKTSWDFVQLFGGTMTDYEQTEGEWNAAQKNVKAMVQKEVSPGRIHALEEKYRRSADVPVKELLHMGSGFGALEELRSPGSAPAGMCFPQASIGKKEAFWLEVLLKHRMEDCDVTALPESYMTDPRYEDCLREAAEKGGFLAKNMYGILCYENCRFEEGISWFEKSAAAKENPLAFRNLFISCKDSDPERAVSYMKKALSLYNGHPARELAEEYVKYLLEQNRYKELWQYYLTLPENLQDDERIVLSVIPAAVELRQTVFLEKAYQREFIGIREGERIFTDCYYAYQAMKEAEETGVEYNNALVAQYAARNEIPYHIDFRQG